MLTSAQVRRQFLDFFVDKHAHTAVPSAPVVPHDDPTLLFTNAGMNQFKDVFLGAGGRDYRRAVDTQKCIRAGGKHNDLEDVGKDTYHHTFFEMLGNWSFGDYFKAEAIDWAWELLVDVWGLDPQRLHATYFEGDLAEGLEPDTEARDLWLKHLPPERVHRGNKKDNFWEMGETGPCGPCSEIHYDRTPPEVDGAALVNQDDPGVIEIWNLVFIQFNRASDGKLTPLPNKHVDTGMGFERITAVLQGVESNYDTDVFTPLFEAIRQVTGAAPYGRKMDAPRDIAYRVIADHIRTLTFAITDGAMPSNEGRGYVLRRILRRAVRYGRQNLGATEPFFYRLVETVVDTMGDVFTELKDNPRRIAEILKEEEELFGKTLDRGIALFDEAAGRGGKQITGNDAFELYATYGFPLDLTQLMASERGMTVDVDGFNVCFAEHQQLSKAGGAGDTARQSLLDIVQQTSLPATQFEGYDELVIDGATLQSCFALHGGRYEPSPDLQVGDKAAIIVDRTPFYAEAGGQVGDTGRIHANRGGVFRVDDTIKLGETYFHLGEVEAGAAHNNEPAFRRDDALVMEVDAHRRQSTMAHHTATHVMNHKLRAVLGEHVQQKGSLVDPEKTRFDFAHNHAVTIDEMARIEQMVNADVAADLPVYAGFAPQEDALKIHGLRAVFGEKYPPTVRVVSIGPKLDDMLSRPDNEQWGERSVEFCGGTHVQSTGTIGSFALVCEEAVAKGVRRVVGIVGPLAEQARADAAALFDRLEAVRDAEADDLRAAVTELTTAINEQTLPVTDRAKLRDALSELQKKLKELDKQQSRAAAGQVVDVARRIAADAEGNVIVARIEADGKTLRTAMDVIRKTRPEAALFLAGVAGDKVALLAAVPQELIDKGLKAGDWVKEIAPVVGGGGGGRPDMAQAGGKDASKIDEALVAARAFAEEKL